MNRSSRPDDLDLRSTSTVAASRSHSRSGSSSDRPLPSNASTASLGVSPLINVNPAPAYIAPSAAARLVTSDHESFFRSLQNDGVIAPGMLTIVVNAGSLALVNQFLDFLLYSILSNAKSTALSALRPAVTEVLRIRLAKEAVAGADQELKSYLGGDDEDFESFDDVLTDARNDEWKLEKTWRKCRVQCMIYSSLGDLEEDDEAFYSENVLEGSVGLEQYQPQSNQPGIVSPAVAIWLTSILEFIGEQTLLVAGHASIARYSAQRIAVASNPSSGASAEVTFPDKPVVEELDTEKVALNPSLGRMWRQWRKKVRGGRGSISIPSRDGVLSHVEHQINQKKASKSEEDRASGELRIQIDSAEHDGKDLPANIPSVEVDNSGSVALSDSLTPIVEQPTPRIFDAKRLGIRDGDYAQTNALSRPHSMINFPTWTTSPPFILDSAIRRPQSLPDLKRGDFADPLAESEDTSRSPDEETNEAFFTPVEEQAYRNIPLPKPDPNEAHELAATSQIHEVDNEDKQSTKPTDPSENEDLVEQCPAVVEPEGVVERKNSQTAFDETTTPANSHDELATATQHVNRSYSSRNSGDDDEYDPYAARSSPPATTPTNSETFFLDESPKNLKSHADTLPPSPRDRSSSSHSKHPSSASSWNSLSDRKIGQVQLIQSSASTHSTPSDRTSNARVFTPPATPEKTRRSSSFSKIQRPTHTSGSSSSQASIVKTFIPWPHEGAKYAKVHESDGESRSSHHSERLASRDDKERSFEELISSGGTIHCTITPDPIRNMEKGRDLAPPKVKTPTSELADFFRSTGPDGRPTTTPSRTIPSSPRTPAHRSPTPASIRTTDNASMSDLRNTAASSSPAYAKSHSSSASISRIQRLLISDLAPPIPSKKGRMRAASAAAGLPSVMRQSRKDGPVANNRVGNRLLPREASGTTGSDTTSALADFFRNTNPPVNGEMPVHRISRSVAPFRSTMDSDQFDSKMDQDIIEEIEHESASTKAHSIVSAPQDSYSSSFTSSTALLRSNSKKTSDYGGTSATSSMPDVKRKQTRVKDPYAIADEDDDFDDMEGLSLVLPKKREEESLVDFLRNTPPPPPAAPQPFVQTDKTVQKKSSSASLMSRFSRTGRKNSIASNADKMPLGTQIGGGASQPKHVPLRVPSVSGASSRRTSSGSDRCPRPSPVAANVDFDNQVPLGNVLGSRNPPRVNAQARNAQTGRNDTNSLADFLKHTGPSPEGRIAQPPKEEGRTLLQKISFARNKKMGVA